MIHASTLMRTESFQEDEKPTQILRMSMPKFVHFAFDWLISGRWLPKCDGSCIYRPPHTFLKGIPSTAVRPEISQK